MPRSLIVIPARLASTRLPRKLLLAETGKPLIQHTYEAAQRAKLPAGLCVAADCEEIASVVRAFGGRVFLTSPTCASGTDRIAEVVPQLERCRYSRQRARRRAGTVGPGDRSGDIAAPKQSERRDGDIGHADPRT